MATEQGRRQAETFSAQSVHRDEYRPPRLPAREVVPISRPRLYVPFTGTSTSSDYRPFSREALLTSSVKCSEPIINHINDHSSDTKSDWNSTHRFDFRFHQRPPSECVNAPSNRRLVLPFTGQSTSRADFRAPPAETIRCNRPGSAALKSFCERENIHVSDLLESAKFEGCSSYVSEYKAIPLPVSEDKLELANFQDPPLRFEGVSESHSQYRTIDLEKGVNDRVDNRTFISSISNPGSVFEATTEFRDSFKPVNIEKKNTVLEPYVMDDPIPFDATTESRASYRPFIIKPEQSLSLSGRESPVFEGNS